MENHGDRPEFQAALEGRVGQRDPLQRTRWART